MCVCAKETRTTKTNTHVYICKYIHTYIHTYIRTYVRTYVRTYIHTYIHTYNLRVLTFMLIIALTGAHPSMSVFKTLQIRRLVCTHTKAYNTCLHICYSVHMRMSTLGDTCMHRCRDASVELWLWPDEQTDGLRDGWMPACCR